VRDFSFFFFLNMFRFSVGWHRRTLIVNDLEPHISNTAFVAPSATLCGRVEVWDFASVWSDAVIRGDVRLVRIGAYTNIQVSFWQTQACF
jgi:hypothetical protein